MLEPELLPWSHGGGGGGGGGAAAAPARRPAAVTLSASAPDFQTPLQHLQHLQGLLQQQMLENSAARAVEAASGGGGGGGGSGSAGEVSEEEAFYRCLRMQVLASGGSIELSSLGSLVPPAQRPPSLALYPLSSIVRMCPGLVCRRVGRALFVDTA